MILVFESDYFLPETEAGAPGRDSRNAYFLRPLERLGLPFVFSLPNPPPLGITLLGTHMRKHGYEVRLFANVFRVDADRRAFFEALEQRPLAVGICTNHLRLPGSVARIAGWARERSPGTRIILGGHFAERVESIRAAGDVTVLGPGEQTLLDLMASLRREDLWEHIPNLVWKSADGWRRTARRENFTLSRRSVPDWGLLAMSPSLCYGVETARGCPHGCVFCGESSSDYRGSTIRPVADVVAELRRDQDIHGVRIVSFTDSDFTAEPARAEELCRGMIDADIRMQWRCFARADDFARRPSLARVMKDAGCLGVFIGVESGSDDILSRMRKGCTAARMREGLSAARAAGLHVHANFLIGFPGETPDTVAETLEFIRTADIDTIHFSPLAAYDELLSDAARRDDRHLGLRSQGLFEWSHGGMDSAEAMRVTARCIDIVATTMERPLLAFQGVPTDHMMAGGLSYAECVELLSAFQAYYRAEKNGAASHQNVALQRIRAPYAKMLSGYLNSGACGSPASPAG